MRGPKWMPPGATRPVSRAGAVGLVIVGHVAMLALLTTRSERDTDSTADERMSLVFVEPLEAAPVVAPVDRLGHPSRPARAPALAPGTTAEPAATARSPSAVDWYAGASEAARRAAAAPVTADFGFPKRQPAPRAKRPFGWDTVHTERVHALEGGGLGIRLSDNCELVLLPLPMGGCALGKRKARGDLFDEMQAPAEPGDWK
jgi:hypothetical protein